jgi:hypothetical protein
MAAVREEVVKIASLIRMARRSLARGGLVDLSAIEDRVKAVCNAALVMPCGDGRTLIADMEGLVDMLDRLGDDLHGQIDHLSTNQAGQAPGAMTDP